MLLGYLPSAGGEAPEVRRISIAFGGDVHGENPIANTIRAGINPLGAAIPLLSAADIAVVNLETAVSARGTAREKQYTFRTSPALLGMLRSGGVDLVSVANNHAYDFGGGAFADTLKSIDTAGLISVGGGVSADAAYAPAIIEQNGVRVGFLGIARVHGGPGAVASETRAGTTDGWNLVATTRAIRAAKKQVDVVVVLAHWGEENSHCPRGVEVAVAKEWVKAGANIIVGGHPHVIQKIEEQPNALIAYSMGNFVFYAHRADAVRTGVLTVDITIADASTPGARSVQITPVFEPLRINPKSGSLRVTTAEERKRDLSDLRAYGNEFCKR